MFHTDNENRSTGDVAQWHNQQGFSLFEVLIATTVMLIVLGAVFTLVNNSMKSAMTTYELTDAQQNLRIAQEFINRDVLNAGDGLRSISLIRMPETFLKGYITRTPVPAAVGGIAQCAIFTSDNNVPANTDVAGSNPAVKILTGTDRQTILEIDPEFNGGQSISLLPTASPKGISPTGHLISIPAVPLMSIFKQGEIYFFTSGIGATFGTITKIDAASRQLYFEEGTSPAPGDPYGLNNTGAGGHIRWVSTNGTLATSLQRMKIIQYYVTDTNLLMRRVFGVEGAGNRDSIIAEHVLDVQFNYSLINTDPLTGVVTPSTTTVLSTPEQQLAVRQVEVRIRVETPHAILKNNKRQEMSMTTSTSVRNMQFRKAL